MRPSLKGWVGFALALPLSGCFLRPHPPEPWPLPKVADAPFRGNWVQTLRLERDGREMPLLAVIETDGTTLTLAGLSPAGQRLVRIAWIDGHVDLDLDPNLPAKINGQAILRDVVFAHWPEASLDRVLKGTRWSAGFADSVRTLNLDGKTWLTVSPETGSDGDGLLVDHRAEGYRVHVSTVEKNGT